MCSKNLMRQIFHAGCVAFAGRRSSVWASTVHWLMDSIEKDAVVWIWARFLCKKKKNLSLSDAINRQDGCCIQARARRSDGPVMQPHDDMMRDRNVKLGELEPQCIAYKPAGDMSQTSWRWWPVCLHPATSWKTSLTSHFSLLFTFFFFSLWHRNADFGIWVTLNNDVTKTLSCFCV